MGTLKQVLKLAFNQLSTKEDPPGSNNVKYNTWYYGREVSGTAYPWCMVFVQWIMDQCNVPIPRTNSCAKLLDLAVYGHRWVGAENLMVGDVAIFTFNSNRTAQHCGIVVNTAGTLQTIEGNTSTTSDDNGGNVMLRTRSYSNVLGAFRPIYEEDDSDMDGSEMLEKIRQDTAKLPAGDWSAHARAAVESFKLINDGNYKSPVTREELAMVLWRLLVLLGMST